MSGEQGEGGARGTSPHKSRAACLIISLATSDAARNVLPPPYTAAVIVLSVTCPPPFATSGRSGGASLPGRRRWRVSTQRPTTLSGRTPSDRRSRWPHHTPSSRRTAQLRKRAQLSRASRLGSGPAWPCKRTCPWNAENMYVPFACDCPVRATHGYEGGTRCMLVRRRRRVCAVASLSVGAPQHSAVNGTPLLLDGHSAGGMRPGEGRLLQAANTAAAGNARRGLTLLVFCAKARPQAGGWGGRRRVHQRTSCCGVLAS